MRKRLTVYEVFERLKSRIVVDGACWLYPQKDRYAKTKVNGKSIPAHRVAWIATNGDIPEGLCVCHVCDRTHCINPQHLWLGTSAENTADKVAKQRQARGESVSRSYSKLTVADVLDIKELYAAGIPRKIIRRLYPVGKSNFYNIVSGAYWAHVTV